MRTAVLASGSGTLLEAMIKAGVPIHIVLSDRNCRAIEVAGSAGIPTCIVDRRSYGYYEGVEEKNWDREGFTRAVAMILVGNQVELVAMAGFMTILHKAFQESYRNRILNSHPALLPAFPGALAVHDAMAAGVSETGATLHIATEELDDSTYILRQVRVPVLPGDTEEVLHERIKVEERILYTEVLFAIQSGALDLDAFVAGVALIPAASSG